MKEYFKNDFFTEEFIKNNGITSLVKIIQHNKGNMRSYGLQSISKLLDFQNTYEYFYKKLDILSNLYEIAVTEDTESIKVGSHALDLIIKIIGGSEDRTMYIIDIGEKYAKKTHTNLFQGIVNNFKEKNKESEIRLKSIIFINTIINFCHPSIHSRILLELQDTGIFELLNKISKQKSEKPTEQTHESNFEEQISLFIQKANQTFEEPEHKVELIKKYIEDMKKHINEIELKNNSLKEQKEFYDYIIKDFIEYVDISDCISKESGKAVTKGSKEKSQTQTQKFDKSLNKNIKIDQSGMVDVKAIFEDENMAELNEIINKYKIVEQEYEKLKQINKNLGGQNGEVSNDEIADLEKQLKLEKETASKMQELKEDFEKKIKELESKIPESQKEEEKKAEPST